MTDLAIVDYGGGNLRSVQRACTAAGLDARLTRDPDDVRRARRVIFPGVGNAEQVMHTLGETGLGEALREVIGASGLVLGICVGAQVILDTSEESSLPCLGFLPGATRRFQFAPSNLETSGLKIPHIGWNEVRVKQPHFLLQSLSPGDELYFVHSYYPDPAQASDVYAVADYGGEFCCALGRDGLFATQFHPEKSGRLGLQLLERFSRWNGETC